jgi:tRNA threonylcarbamoyladenosine biosynthesis protein TsaE
MFSLQSFSEQDTTKIAALLAPLLKDGDVIALMGDLGAGKTFFSQQLVQALGIEEDVTSPTFTLLQIYDGKIPVHHFDLYRLEDARELDEIGFYEYTSYGISLIEWADKFGTELPDEYLSLTMKCGSEILERLLVFEPHGRRYEAICEELMRLVNAVS